MQSTWKTKSLNWQEHAQSGYRSWKICKECSLSSTSIWIFRAIILSRISKTTLSVGHKGIFTSQSHPTKDLLSLCLLLLRNRHLLARESKSITNRNLDSSRTQDSSQEATLKTREVDFTRTCRSLTFRPRTSRTHNWALERIRVQDLRFKITCIRLDRLRLTTTSICTSNSNKWTKTKL